MSVRDPDQERLDQASQVFVLVAARAFCFPLVILLRRRFGSEYFGLQALGSYLALPLYLCAWHPRYDVTALAGLLPVTFVLMILARWQIFRRWRRGEVLPSDYGGDSRLQLLFPRLDLVLCRVALEPGLAVLIGLLLIGTDRPLGSYFLHAGAALLLTEGLFAVHDWNLQRRMRDAVLVATGRARGSAASRPHFVH